MAEVEAEDALAAAAVAEAAAASLMDTVSTGLKKVMTRRTSPTEAPAPNTTVEPLVAVKSAASSRTPFRYA